MRAHAASSRVRGAEAERTAHAEGRSPSSTRAAYDIFWGTEAVRYDFIGRMGLA
jgi:hypothetical protein